METLIVHTNDSGQRLDRYLRKLLVYAPLSLIQKLIRTKKVKVSGKIRPKDYKLLPGDTVTLFIREPEFKSYTMGDRPQRQVDTITFSVVYEDDDILVVNKPSGLPSQPGSGYRDASLIDEVLQYLHDDSQTRAVTFRPALANRIDRGTSGLILVGKTAAALRSLNAQLAERTMTKVYLALVVGTPRDAAGVIDIPLEATDQHDLHQPKMQLGAGKHALTRYKVTEQFGGAALLEVIIETGRTHQIRAHLASLGIPIIGDTRYGNGAGSSSTRNDDASSDADVATPTPSVRLMLHAWKMTFAHPVSGEAMTVEAPLPAHFTEYVMRLRNASAGDDFGISSK